MNFFKGAMLDSEIVGLSDYISSKKVLKEKNKTFIALRENKKALINI